MRLRINWRLAGAGLSSEPRCKETEVCGGLPEAPPQSSGSRFSDLPLLVLVVSRNNCNQNPRLIDITHQYVFSDLVPRIPGIQCKSLNLNAREHCPCYGYPPGISFNHAFVKRFSMDCFKAAKLLHSPEEVFCIS